MAGKIKVVHGNMHGNKVASNLLRQIQAEHEANLMSEQYENPDTQTWILDETGTADIWITNPTAHSGSKVDKSL